MLCRLSTMLNYLIPLFLKFYFRGGILLLVNTTLQRKFEDRAVPLLVFKELILLPVLIFNLQNGQPGELKSRFVQGPGMGQTALNLSICTNMNSFA